MGNFSNNSITDKGRLLLADVQAGAVFTPTRIVIGSGSLPNTVTTQTITDVIAPVKSLAINKKKRTPDGKCTFGGAYSNNDITEAFYFRELALYAKAVYLNNDGSVKSEVAEVLYSYGNAGATADYMPAYSTSTVVEKQIDLVVWIGNDAQVNLTIESGIYASKEELADVANSALKKSGDRMNGALQVDVDGGNAVLVPDATGTYLQTYKTGDWARRRALFVKNIDVSPDKKAAVTLGTHDDGTWKEYPIIHTGNMDLITPAEIGVAPAVEDSSYPGCYYRMVDGVKEWINPPMVINAEYRTTERFGQCPVWTSIQSVKATYDVKGQCVCSTNINANGVTIVECRRSNPDRLYCSANTYGENVSILVQGLSAELDANGTWFKVQLWYTKSTDTPTGGLG